MRGPGFAAAKVLDGGADSYWSTPDGITTPSLVLDLPPGRTFDLIRLREYLPLRLRVTRFAVDAEVDGQWRELAQKECIGAQRIIRLAQPITARRLRLRILEGPACPAIREIALFRQAAPVPVAPVVETDASIVATSRWTIAAASAPGAQALLDTDAATSWALPAPRPGIPASVTIDLGETETLAGFSLTPSRAVMADTAPPKAYRVEVSADGKTWREAGQGELPNIAYALATQRITFAAPVTTRLLRFSFAETAIPARHLAIAGIGAFRPRVARAR